MVATISAFVTVGSFSDAERPLCNPTGGADIAVQVGDPPITLASYLLCRLAVGWTHT
jgi:hypothetical protein